MKAIPLSTLTLFVCIALVSCKRDNDNDVIRPNAFAEIHFAYEKPGILDRFSNQTNLKIDSLKTLVNFGFVVDEKYHYNFCGFTTDSGIIEFNVTTQIDQEVFNNRKGISSHGTWRSMTGNNFSFGGDVYIPFKLSNSAVKGNDTLEISTNGDWIKAYYLSKYSNLSASDSIQIIP